MKSEKIAWAAGVVEADGTITFHKGTKDRQGKHPRLRVTMADRDIVEDLQNTLGGLFRGPLPLSYSGNKGNLVSPPKAPKPLFTWEVNRKVEVIRVLRTLRPFLHERRGKKADEVLAFLEGDTP